MDKLLCFDTKMAFKLFSSILSSILSLKIGDFNGDGRSDILCQQYGSGSQWVRFANTEGIFEALALVWSSVGWCGHETTRLFVGNYFKFNIPLGKQHP